MFQKSWYMIGRALVERYLRSVMKADIYHTAPLPEGPKIIAVNHPSTNDPAFVTALFKEQVSILILETLFKVPVFGRSLRAAGHVPVVAGNGRAALEEAVRLLRAGRSVMIFPEGEISPSGGFHKPHTGVARMALETGAPVIPVGISLDQKLIHMVHTQVEGKMEPGAWYLHGPYAMTVGEPVTFGGDASNHEHVRSISNQIMDRIRQLKDMGDYRLAAAQNLAVLRAARRNAFARAAHWATYSVPLRAIQSTLYFLIVSAGKV